MCEQRDNVNFDRSTFTHGVDLFVGLALEVHLGEVEAQHASDVGPHLILDGAEFGLFEDDSAVEIGDLVAGRADAGTGLGKKDLAVLAFVARVGVGKELTYVGLCQGTQQGVGDGVIEGVAIAVGDRAAIMRKFDATQNQLAPGPGRRTRFEAVKVVSVTDANREHGRGYERGTGEGFTWLHFAREPFGPATENSRPGGLAADILADHSTCPEGGVHEACMRKTVPSRKSVAFITGVLAVASVLALPGCQQFERYTYRSDVHSQKTITLLDTSNGEKLLTVEIPSGQQLNMVFDSDDVTAEKRGHDTLRWAVRKIGDDTVSGGNVMQVPPPSSRRIDMSLRQ